MSITPSNKIQISINYLINFYALTSTHMVFWTYCVSLRSQFTRTLSIGQYLLGYLYDGNMPNKGHYKCKYLRLSERRTTMPGCVYFLHRRLFRTSNPNPFQAPNCFIEAFKRIITHDSKHKRYAFCKASLFPCNSESLRSLRYQTAMLNCALNCLNLVIMHSSHSYYYP